MGTFNFYLLEKAGTKGRYRASGERTVMMVYQDRGAKFKQSTGLKVPETAWDTKHQCVRPYADGAAAINALLEKIRREVAEIVAVLRLEGLEPEAARVKERYIGSRSAVQSKDGGKEVAKALADFIAAHRDTKSKSYEYAYQSLAKDLEAFSSICGRTFGFADFNAKFFQGFANYLTTVRKLVDGTVGRRLVFLRMFLNWSVRTGLTKSTEFREVRILKGQKAKHIHLTEEELAAVAALDLSEDPKLAAIKDVFLFGCYTGLRYSDLALSVRPENIVDGPGGSKAVRLVIKKTKDPILVPLNKPAMEILARHSQTLPAPSAAVANRGLKEIARRAGIGGMVEKVNQRGNERLEDVKPKWQRVSTHTARRTYATLSKSRGMDVVALQRILGHHDISQTLEYIKDTDSFQADEVKNAWG